MNSIFVISGPSGSGKSTLINMLTKHFDDLKFSVSHTTRKKRKNETESKDYHFISEDKFRGMMKKGLFAEWAEVHGELYGTSFEEIDKKSKGKDILILDIDVQGAGIIKKNFPESLLVFIMPPGIDVLQERILKREKNISRNFEKRLVTAKEEIAMSGSYDVVIVNDILDISFQQLKKKFQEYRRSVAEMGKQD